MNPSRMAIAGVVGGVVMFVWGAVLHLATPLATMGMQNLPDEAVVTTFLKSKIHERGLYRYPKPETHAMSNNDTAQAGPSGIIVFDPESGKMTPGQLAIELISDVAAGLLMAVVFSRMQMTKWLGAILGTAIGLFGWFSIDASYWNWFRFPSELVMASMIEQGIGGLLMGITIAFVLGKARRVPLM